MPKFNAEEQEELRRILDGEDSLDNSFEAIRFSDLDDFEEQKSRTGKRMTTITGKPGEFAKPAAKGLVGCLLCSCFYCMHKFCTFNFNMFIIIHSIAPEVRHSHHNRFPTQPSSTSSATGTTATTTRTGSSRGESGCPQRRLAFCTRTRSQAHCIRGDWQRRGQQQLIGCGPQPTRLQTTAGQDQATGRRLLLHRS